MRPIHGPDLIPCVFFDERITLEIENSLPLTLRSAASANHLDCLSVLDRFLVHENEHLGFSRKLEIVAATKLPIKNKDPLYLGVIKPSLPISFLLIVNFGEGNFVFFADFLELIDQGFIVLCHEHDERMELKIFPDQIEKRILERLNFHRDLRFQVEISLLLS